MEYNSLQMEIFEHLVALLAALLLQTSISLAYRTCYDCARVPFPKECDHIIKCTDDSSCYVEELISDSGVVLFNLGCRSKTRCQQVVRRQLSTTISEDIYDASDDVNGDLTICEECCQEEHCNSRGCNSEPLPPIGSRGPVCYNCHQQSSEDSCDQLKVCDTTEFCGNIQRLPVGRRNVPDCTGCCSEDYCNRNCSAVRSHNKQSGSTIYPPSTTPATVSSSTSAQSSTRTALTSSKPSTSSSTTATISSSTTADTIIDRRLCQLLGYEYVITASFHTCYKLYSDKMLNWDQSRDKCQQDGGDLVVFQDIEEEKFFVNMTKKANHLDLVRFWVGASDQNGHHDWLWLDESVVNKSYFHPKEPNHQGGNEHCAALAQFAVHGNIALNDDICSVLTNFICEITLKHLQSKTTPATPTHCRNSDYTYIPTIGMCYKLYNTVQKTQSEARSTCQGQQADLLILRNITIEHFFQHLHFYTEDEAIRYWLGAERMPNDHRNQYDSFRWYNGHVLNRGLEWFEGEPNDSDNDEDCLTFTFFFTKTLPFALNDDRCSKQHFFICEEKCPDLSYQYFPALDLCFKIYNEHVTWSEARDRCRRDHSDLLEPDTPDKLAFMEKLLNETARGDAEEFWIGATDENHDGAYQWMTSSKVVPSEFWHKGEPSSQTADEHCASLYWFSSDSRILMNDVNCNTNKFRFICQDIW